MRKSPDLPKVCVLGCFLTLNNSWSYDALVLLRRTKFGGLLVRLRATSKRILNICVLFYHHSRWATEWLRPLRTKIIETGQRLRC